MNRSYEPIKILLAVGTRIYRDATRELLEKYDNVRVEFAAAQVSDILTPLSQLSIDLLIIDLRIPGSVEFVQLSEKIRPNLKFIVMAAGDDKSQLNKVHHLSSLIGCMLDDMPASYLIDRINEHLASAAPAVRHDLQADLCANISVSCPATDPQTQLTKRQFRILSMIESGHSNKEISRRLNIETCTVKNHVHNILQRLQANSRCEAAAMFRRAMINRPSKADQKGQLYA